MKINVPATILISKKVRSFFNVTYTTIIISKCKICDNYLKYGKFVWTMPSLVPSFMLVKSGSQFLGIFSTETAKP